MSEKQQTLVKMASTFVTKYICGKLDASYTYHNLEHTREVAEAAVRIGEASGLAESDLEIVAIAAWFHDAGITEQYLHHEEKSAEIAEQFLKKHDYDRDSIMAVKRCILATNIRVTPTTLQEKVLCDADLEHIGKKSFWERSDQLRQEWENKFERKYSDAEWLQNQIGFLHEISFHTDYAIERRSSRLEKNKMKLQKKLDALEKGEPMEDEQINSETEGKKKKKDKKTEDFLGRGDRGVETMFRTTSRNHVTFSSMVDSKANIMLSINALVISVVISVLFRKLDSNPYMAIPTFVFLAVCLTTIVFAVLASRPKVTSGIFTREDIENKEANLLFFGNFYNVSVDDFEWGIREMLKDKDYLYGSMIRDFYYLGQVLGKKYRYLRISYNVFMYGFVFSTILYVVMFLVFANQPVDIMPFGQ
jgi:predicted metal-dependent HD superfamily phosphohydrolase